MNLANLFMLFNEPSRGMQFKHIARSMAQEYFHSEPRQQRLLEKGIKGDTRSGKMLMIGDQSGKTRNKLAENLGQKLT